MVATVCISGDRGSNGNVGVIHVEKGNKDDLISFIMKRLETVINESIIKDNNDYLELDMKYALQDIMTATRKYLGKGSGGGVNDKDRVSNSKEIN